MLYYNAGPAIYPPINGMIVGDNFTDVTMSMEFGCNPGYFLSGHAVTTCEYTGSGVDWSQPVPVCLSTFSPALYTYYTHGYYTA